VRPVNQHRSGLAFEGKAHCLSDLRLNMLRLLEAKRALDQRRCHCQLIDCLEMEPMIWARRAPDEVYERDRVLQRLRHCRQSPGETGARNGDKRRQTPGRTIIAIGHETGGELVRREHGADAALAQGLVERQVLTAGYTKHVIDAVRLEGGTELGSADFHLWLRANVGCTLELAALTRASSAFAPDPTR